MSNWIRFSFCESQVEGEKTLKFPFLAQDCGIFWYFWVPEGPKKVNFTLFSYLSLHSPPNNIHTKNCDDPWRNVPSTAKKLKYPSLVGTKFGHFRPPGGLKRWISENPLIFYFPYLQTTYKSKMKVIHEEMHPLSTSLMLLMLPPQTQEFHLDSAYIPAAVGSN